MGTHQSENEFGVSTRRWMPLAWRARRNNTPGPEHVSALNQANEHRLKTILDFETRDQPSTDTATLEALIIEVLHSVKQLPSSHSVLLTSHNIEWADTSAQARFSVGDFGIVSLCLNPQFPYEVQFFAEVSDVQKDTQGWHIKAALKSRSEHVVDLYQQLVFIYYRRERREQRIEHAEKSSH